MTNEPPNYYPPPNPPADSPAATQTIPAPAWGAPQPPTPSAWSTKKTLAAVGIALGIAVVGGGSIYALSNSTSSSVQQGFGAGGMGAPGQDGGQFRGGMRGGMGMALHGEFVVSDGNGGYTTELTQEGTVTAVSDTSLTVKSADGFSQTYALTSASGVAVGDTVNVRATESNGTATAISVRSGDAGFDGGPGGGLPPGPNGTGNP